MPKTIEFDPALLQQVQKLRDTDELKWDQIAEEIGKPAGTAMLIYNFATVKPKDRLKNATEADIVRLRDEESLSWGVISARTGYPEGSCRSMYEKGSNTSAKGHRIGKGGRPFLGNSDAPAKPPAPKKSAGKKATAEGAPAAGDAGQPVLQGLSADEVKAKIVDRAIKVNLGTGVETIKVAEVVKVTATAATVKDETGQSRAFKLAAVQIVSKNRWRPATTA